MPDLPTARRNPLRVLAATFVPPDDPRSLPKPKSVEQKIFSERQSRERLFEEPSVLFAAEAEFDKEVVPRLHDGSMSPIALDAWNRHWRSLDESVVILRGFLDDDEAWEDRHPAYGILRDRLYDEAGDVIDAFEGVLADASPLVAFELRAKAMHAALERVAFQIEALRLGEALAALTWVQELVDSGIQEGRDIDDLYDLQAMVERVQEHSADPRSRLHRTSDVSAALVARFESLDAAFCEFARTAPNFHLDSQAWLAHAARRLILSNEGSLASVLGADRVQAYGMKEKAARQIARLLEAFTEEATYRAEVMQKDRERANEEETERRRMHLREERAAVAAQEVIDYALKRQLALRQMSEGKYGLALTTQILGAQTGALYEGLFK